MLQDFESYSMLVPSDTPQCNQMYHAQLKKRYDTLAVKLTENSPKGNKIPFGKASISSGEIQHWECVSAHNAQRRGNGGNSQSREGKEALAARYFR